MISRGIAMDIQRFFNQKTPKLAGEGSSINRDGIQHTCDYVTVNRVITVVV